MLNRFFKRQSDVDQIVREYRIKQQGQTSWQLIVRNSLIVLVIVLGTVLIFTRVLPSSVMDSVQVGFNRVLSLLPGGSTAVHDHQDLPVYPAWRVDPEAMPVLIRTPGRIDFVEKMEIHSRVAGRIESIYVDEGDLVRRGQPIVQIERLPLELELQQKRANLQSSESEYRLARERYANARRATERRINEIEKARAEERRLASAVRRIRRTYERRRTLYEQEVISDEQYEEVRNNLVSAEADYRQAEKDLENARVGFRDIDIIAADETIPEDEAEKRELLISINTKVEQAEVDVAGARVRAMEAEISSMERMLAETTIRAPADSIVAAKNRSVGEEVSGGGGAGAAERAILILVDIAGVYARLPVRESELQYIELGQNVEITVDAFGGASFEGPLTLINPLVDELTHTAEVKALIDNTDLRLRPGMFIRGSIDTGEIEDTIYLPERAVVPAPDGGAIVFIVREGRSFSREIETGRQTERGIPVLTGLEKDEVVIVDNLETLRDGMDVNIRIENENDASDVEQAGI